MEAGRQFSSASARTATPASRSVSGYTSSVDVEMTDVDTTTVADPGQKKFVIAVDYGTTFSSVSFVILWPGQSANDIRAEDIRAEDIETISNYPEDPSRQRQSAPEVPSEIWYLDVPKRPRGRPRKHPLPGTSDADMGEDMSDDDVLFCGETNPADAAPRKWYWGYEIQEYLGRADGLDPKEASVRCIKRGKLLLDESEHTEDCRKDLSKQLKQLKDKKLIKRDEDPIADFLTALFTHTRKELTAGYGFTDSCEVEFVLCVPPVWSVKASRKMEAAMTLALHMAGFKSTQSGILGNFFLVSEPEAAATSFLAAGKWDENIRVSPSLNTYMTQVY
jgi:hypothetical protein